MLHVPPRRIGRVGDWLRVVLVVIAVAHCRLSHTPRAGRRRSLAT